MNSTPSSESATFRVPYDSQAVNAEVLAPRMESAAKPARDTGHKGMSVVVVEDLSSLDAHIPAWEKLLQSTLEPNVFYEPWMLIPGLKTFGPVRKLKIVLIYTPDPARVSGPQLLCGFFPLEINDHYRGLAKKIPIRTLRLWEGKDEFCYLATPLVRAEYGRECLTAFFDWLATGSHGCSLMEFGGINGDGPFHQLLVDYFHNNPRLPCVTECFTRALFRPSASSDEYVSAALPGVRRKELRRQERRLADVGVLEYKRLEAGGDVEAWVDDFLQFEAKSWKGAAGRALVSDEKLRSFFSTIAKEAFRRGQLMMLSLHLGGRPIAYKFNLLSAPGSFAIKIAFDEEYARFSPGVLLELENIRQLHENATIRWMDSCADPDRLMINRLWPDRRTIPTLVVGTGQGRGDFFVAAIPLLRWLNRKLLRRGHQN